MMENVALIFFWCQLKSHKSDVKEVHRRSFFNNLHKFRHKHLELLLGSHLNDVTDTLKYVVKASRELCFNDI